MTSNKQIREEKMLREILVVRSDIVYADIWSDRPGFIAYDEADFENIILEHYEYQQRWKMEQDTSYQQPIPYVIIHHPESNKFIAYQRGDHTSIVWENRLFAQWSLGVWGHIEKEQENDENPLYTTLFREIEEEMGLTDITNIKILWYIVDRTVPVNLYHLWVLYIAETKTKNITEINGELEDVFFLTKEEIEEIIISPDTELESWSVIAWNAYKKYINNWNA